MLSVLPRFRMLGVEWQCRVAPAHPNTEFQKSGPCILPRQKNNGAQQGSVSRMVGFNFVLCTDQARRRGLRHQKPPYARHLHGLEPL